MNSNDRNSRLNSRERSNRSVFSRLGSYSPNRWHNSNENIQGSRSSLDHNNHENFDNHDQMRIVVRNDNYQGNGSLENVSSFPPYPHQPLRPGNDQSEIIYAIKCLEQQTRENMRHINGIKITVDNYHREIAKLETIVVDTSQEVERLKNQLTFQTRTFNR